MKAFLLAAGAGRRLRPLTDSVPKCLVPIRGTPLLALWLQLLEQHGVTDVLLTVHHLHEHVSEFLKRHQTSISVETVYEARLLGSAGTVLANRGFVENEANFLVLYADVLTNVDLGRLIRFHVGAQALLTLGVVPTDRPTEKGTVVLGPSGTVIAFEEKAAQPRSNLANAGVYVARQELFEHFPPAVPDDGVVDFGCHILPRLVPHLGVYRVEEFLADVGTPAAYQQAEVEWPGLSPAPMRAEHGAGVERSDPTE